MRLCLRPYSSVEFVSNVGSYGAGVAIFETGRAFGGDAQYYYLGTCKVDGNVASVDMAVAHYTAFAGWLGKWLVVRWRAHSHLMENPAATRHRRAAGARDGWGRDCNGTISQHFGMNWSRCSRAIRRRRASSTSIEITTVLLTFRMPLQYEGETYEHIWKGPARLP